VPKANSKLEQLVINALPNFFSYLKINLEVPKASRKVATMF